MNVWNVMIIKKVGLLTGHGIGETSCLKKTLEEFPERSRFQRRSHGLDMNGTTRPDGPCDLTCLLFPSSWICFREKL